MRAVLTILLAAIALSTTSAFASRGKAENCQAQAPSSFNEPSKREAASKHLRVVDGAPKPAPKSTSEGKAISEKGP